MSINVSLVRSSNIPLQNMGQSKIHNADSISIDNNSLNSYGTATRGTKENLQKSHVLKNILFRIFIFGKWLIFSNQFIRIRIKCLKLWLSIKNCGYFHTLKMTIFIMVVGIAIITCIWIGARFTRSTIILKVNECLPNTLWRCIIKWMRWQQFIC